MKWLIAIGVAVIVSAWVFTDAARYIKTFQLILAVKPYEQSGSSGSILVIGDSTGYGTGAKEAGESVAGRIGAAFPSYSITNNSVNGRRVNAAQKVVAELDTHYDLIILQIGANDILAKRSVGEVVADVIETSIKAADHAAHVLVITSGNIGASPAFAGEEAKYYTIASREYDARMRVQTADLADITFVPLFDDPANDPFVKEPRVYMAADGLHPSSAGYEQWFLKARPHLDDIL